MEINDLDPDEWLALVGLLKVIVQADRTLSPQELDQLRKLERAMGAEPWAEAKARAAERCKTKDDPRAVAREVQRQPARALIFDLLYEMAAAEQVAFEEELELSWLARLWEIDLEQKQAEIPR